MSKLLILQREGFGLLPCVNPLISVAFRIQLRSLPLLSIPDESL